MTRIEGLTCAISIDIEAVEKEFDLLFRLMRKRKISELYFEDLVRQIVGSHTVLEWRQKKN